MGRNAAFGRPAASERLRLWWYAKSQTWRTNLLLGLAVGAVVLVLMIAATRGDSARTQRQVKAARPPTTGAPLKPLSTVVVGDLRAAGAATPSELPGSTTTSITTTTTTPVAPIDRSTPPETPTTTPRPTVAVEREPATTVPTSEVIFSQPADPAPTTVPRITVAPVVTTVPPTTAPPTTAPLVTTTTTPTTAAPGIPLPPGLPPLFGPR